MRNTLRGLTLACAAGLLSACGGSDSSTGPSASSSLSASEAQLVSVNLFTEISRALSTATVVHNTIPVSSLAAASALVPTTINETVNGTCAKGGTIKGTYSITTDFNTSGSGSESGTVSVTSSGCIVSTGTRDIAVDGAFTLTFSVAFTSGAQTANYLWAEKGNFTWSGGSCAIDYNVQLTPAGKESITGSFCGQTINYSN